MVLGQTASGNVSLAVKVLRRESDDFGCQASERQTVADMSRARGLAVPPRVLHCRTCRSHVGAILSSGRRNAEPMQRLLLVAALISSESLTVT